MEGDTPSFLGLIDNGLGWQRQPGLRRLGRTLRALPGLRRNPPHLDQQPGQPRHRHRRQRPDRMLRHGHRSGAGASISSTTSPRAWTGAWPTTSSHIMKLALILATLTACAFPTQAKPLKVFILAGQSNMEGPANINTFDYIGDDPATAPMLKMMRGADGKPADLRWRVDFLSHRCRREELHPQRQTHRGLRLDVGDGSHQARRQDRPGVHLRPHDGRGASMNRCSSSRRRGAARACTPISARPAPGRT